MAGHNDERSSSAETAHSTSWRRVSFAISLSLPPQVIQRRMPVSPPSIAATQRRHRSPPPFVPPFAGRRSSQPFAAAVCLTSSRCQGTAGRLAVAHAKKLWNVFKDEEIPKFGRIILSYAVNYLMSRPVSSSVPEPSLARCRT